MSKAALHGTLKELTINLRWALTLVKQLKKHTDGGDTDDDDVIQRYLNQTKRTNDHMGKFCTSLDNVLNVPEHDEEVSRHESSSGNFHLTTHNFHFIYLFIRTRLESLCNQHRQHRQHRQSVSYFPPLDFSDFIKLAFYKPFKVTKPDFRKKIIWA